MARYSNASVLGTEFVRERLALLSRLDEGGPVDGLLLVADLFALIISNVAHIFRVVLYMAAATAALIGVLWMLGGIFLDGVFCLYSRNSKTRCLQQNVACGGCVLLPSLLLTLVNLISHEIDLLRCRRRSFARRGISAEMCKYKKG